MKQFGDVIAMFRTTLKNLAAHKLRLLTTSLAVLLGVAFMAGTLVLTDTIGQTFDGLFADANAGTDAYVRGEAALRQRPSSATSGPGSTPSLVDTIAGVDGVAAAEGDIEGYAQLVDKRRQAHRRPGAWARPPSAATGWPTTDAQPVRARRRAGPRRRPTRSSSTRRSAERRRLRTSATRSRCSPRPATAGRHGRRHRHLRRQPTARRRLVRAVHPDAAQALPRPSPGKVDADQGRRRRRASSEERARRAHRRRSSPTGTEVLTGAEITAEDQQRRQGGHGVLQHLPAGRSP